MRQVCFVGEVLSLSASQVGDPLTLALATFCGRQQDPPQHFGRAHSLAKIKIGHWPTAPDAQIWALQAAACRSCSRGLIIAFVSSSP